MRAAHARVLLFTGKGGVGKTTTAAATAALAAEQGRRTLVLSTDAAHSLGDALDVDLTGDAPREVAPGLHALQVAAGDGGPSWRVLRDYLGAVLDGLGVDPVLAEEMTTLPGAEEVTGLLAVGAHARSGEHDLVVVDCAPSAETLRLLAMPEVLAQHLERLMPAQRALARSLRPATAAVTGLPLPGPEVGAVLVRWQQRLRGVQRLLTGPRTSVRLVLTPERVVVAETRRTWTSLALHGLTVDGIVLNRLLDDPGPDSRTDTPADLPPDPWRAAVLAGQRRGAAEVGESFAGIPLVRSPFLADEPVGIPALRALAAAWSGSALPGPEAVEGGLRVGREGRDFFLHLPLPHATAGDVGLQRRGTELVLTVGGHRRVVSLPAVLQRCVVSGAQVREGGLRIRFVPDEEVWPRD